MIANTFTNTTFLPAATTTSACQREKRICGLSKFNNCHNNELTDSRRVPLKDKILLGVLAVNMVVGVFAGVYFGINYLADFIENKMRTGQALDKFKKWLEKKLDLDDDDDDDDRRSAQYFVRNCKSRRANTKCISELQRVMKDVIMLCRNLKSADRTYTLMNSNFDQAVLYEIVSSSHHAKFKNVMKYVNANVR